MNSIIKYLRDLADRGFSVPIIRDPLTDQPSITLSFPYIAFFLAVYSVVKLLEQDVLYGAIAGVSLWLMATVLYMIRKLNKVKLDIDDKEIELDGGDNESEK
jgi:hypothetical protein